MSESDITCWIVTEGIAGTENQCLGIAEALGVRPVIKRIKLKSPWRQLSPWLRFGHQYALASGSATLAPPYPDILIAGGRKSIGIALHVKKKSGGKTFLVQVQDPRISPKHFDLVIAPQHDGIRGGNVLLTTGALHRVTPEKIAAEKKKFESKLSHLPHPRVALLIGGSGESHTMTHDNTKKLVDDLLKLKAGIMVTASRRTGAENTRLLREKLTGENIFFWDGTGDNPYFAMLGLADHIIVTEDSVSMISEAISTGKPVHIAHLDGGSGKFDLFHQDLQQKNYAKPFTGVLETWSYTPPSDITRIVNEIKQRMNRKE